MYIALVLNKLMRKFYIVTTLFCLFTGALIAQSPLRGEQAEVLWNDNETKWESNMLSVLQTTPDELHTFLQYNQTDFFAVRNRFFTKAMSGKMDSGKIAAFFNHLQTKYKALYTTYLYTKQNYPATIASHIAEQNYSKNDRRPSGTCPTACNNIDFENGSLSGWTACFAKNNEFTTNATDFSTTAFTCSGILGNVTEAAYDNSTTSYQVSLVTGSAVDPIVGPALPMVAPGGGKYSACVGDGVGIKYGVAELSNQFTVSASSPILTLQYAAVLENPNHTYYQQPWFQIEVLDQNNNEISACGQYFVVSAAGLQGFHAVYYPIDVDSVYYKPWTTVYVPLYKYVGQCVTVIFKTADCAQGGHFGYAYVDASCSNTGVISSAPAYCGQTYTLTAPAGQSSYTWSGPCISGPVNQQSVAVTCAGTYSVIVKGSATCTDTLSVNVSNVAGPPPVPNFTTDTVCSGSVTHFTNRSNPLSGAGVKFYWDFYNNGKIEDSTVNPTFKFTTTGMHQVRLLEEVNGCEADTIMNVFVAPLPYIISSSFSLYYCSKGSPVTLTASSGLTYLWNTGATTSSITVTPTTVTTYSVKSTEGACVSTASAAITPSVSPSSSITSFTNVTCNNACNGKATVTANGGTTPYTYAWHTAPAFYTQSVIGLCAGADTVVVTDAHGCQSVSSVTITQPLTTLVFNTSQANVRCYGNATGYASVTVSGGTSPYKYAWSNGLTTSAVSGLIAGQYTVSVTDAASHCGSVIVDITQPAAPLSLSTNIILPDCGQANGLIVGIAVGGTPKYTYKWSPSSITTTTDSAKNLTTGLYTVVVTDSLGCVASSGALRLNSLGAVLSLSISAVKCNGSNTGAATAQLNGTAPYTYSWSTGVTTDTAKGLNASTYSVTVTDAAGCKVSSSFIVPQPTLLTVLTGSTSSCNTIGNGTATASASGGTAPYSYSWSNGKTTASITALPAATYTITVTDFNGCKAIKTVTVAQSNSMRDSIVSQTNEACFGNCTGKVVAGVKNGTSPYTYLWTGGSTAARDSNLCAGTYKVVITDKNGCKDSATALVIQPLALSVSLSEVSACYDSSNGSALATPSGGTAGYIYTWSPGGLTTQSITGIKAGAYSVTVTDKNSCTASGNITVTEETQMRDSIKAFANPSCFPGNDGWATLGIKGGIPPYTYQWSPLTWVGATVYNLSAGTYSVTTTDSKGCVSNTATLVLVSPPPFVTTVCCDTTMLASQMVQLSVTPALWHLYAWSPSTGLNCTQCPNPQASPSSTTTYYVTITDDTTGCSVTDSVTITIENGIHIYNALTPNGDGKDDYWQIGGIESFSDNQVSIFNRWGVEVWSGTGYNNSSVVFTGIDKQGQLLPSATYYYMLTVSGTKYKGWIQLMR